ncbi:MAG: class II fumarate hydratase [Betaproteobacteria bacterium AqS2]|uniref:Fumarate hydratase class II n=1 Tax=Candidatus Amphirhobacter heronislandensis TaxID=1732024 RepID=A0A930UCI2_9GAMM|nr:class II fumarate hydratase [Betaproteobacteria bacterium AqS2]
MPKASKPAKAPATKTMRDSMGPVQVPRSALYGATTQRAVENFPISGQRMPAEFITALALIKAAAAEANGRLRLLPLHRARAIANAAVDVYNGEHLDQFPVDVYQTGSGTSTNMNMNEVLAALASKELGEEVSPNDDVNMGQSSNDVIPTAIHVAAAMEIDYELLPALRRAERGILTKSRTLRDCVTTGRTHLMDAMPVTLEQELACWAAQLREGHDRLAVSARRLRELAQGGTAVGTGVNTHPRFAGLFARELSSLSGLRFRPSANFFARMASQDTAVEVSGQLRALAGALTKIANDLRWMNSGPLAGLGEIQLKALQPGSSIMPGKVNPVIPEACAMACARVEGNDCTIAAAGKAGNFQLNVMLPVIASSLLESVKLLAGVLPLMRDAVADFRPDRRKMRAALDLNPILVTALNPYIGYQAAAKVAKAAYRERRPIVEVAARMTGMPRAQLAKLLDPAKLVKGGLR